MTEKRKVVDYSFIAMGQGRNTPGFIGLRIEFSDGTGFSKGFIWGKNKDKFKFPETSGDQHPSSTPDLGEDE